MCQSRVLCTWHMSYERTILSLQLLPLKSLIERTAIEELSILTRRCVYGPSTRFGRDHRSFFTTLWISVHAIYFLLR